MFLIIIRINNIHMKNSEIYYHIENKENIIWSVNNF